MFTILVVDDETSITELLSIVLTNDGHKVLTANSLEHAIGMLRLFKFDLVVTDFHLSATDRGTELATFNTPLILMSGGISEEEFAAQQGNFDIFIPKPFSPSELRIAINDLLNID